MHQNANVFQQDRGHSFRNINNYSGEDNCGGRTDNSCSGRYGTNFRGGHGINFENRIGNKSFRCQSSPD